MADVEALDRLARAIASALQEFVGGPGSGESEPEPVVAHPPRPAEEHRLGKRQLQIAELPDLAGEDGLKTADVAAAVGYEVPNTYTALQALARAQVVEQVPGKEPQHWRLVRRYRAGSGEFARMAAVLEAGEWTSAADVSIAVRGDIHSAAAIAQAALSHRILGSDHPDDEGRRRLAAEGIVFRDDGSADPRQQLSWHELRRRAAAAEERRRAMSTGALNYIQIPAVDFEESATFYEQVFGWKVTWHPTVGKDYEQTSYPEFTDSTGHNGGGFVLGRPPSREPGLLPTIAVDSIDHTLTAVTANGGEIVKPRTAIAEGMDWEAIFRDPAGNAFGLYEEAKK